jgi:hypothetical protein
MKRRHGRKVSLRASAFCISSSSDKFNNDYAFRWISGCRAVLRRSRTSFVRMRFGRQSSAASWAISGRPQASLRDARSSSPSLARRLQVPRRVVCVSLRGWPRCGRSARGECARHFTSADCRILPSAANPRAFGPGSHARIPARARVAARTRRRIPDLRAESSQLPRATGRCELRVAARGCTRQRMEAE